MEIFTKMELVEVIELLGWYLSQFLFHIFSGFSVWIILILHYDFFVIWVVIGYTYNLYDDIEKFTEGLYCHPWTLVLAKHFTKAVHHLNEACKIVHWCSV